jgi:hypothetical protein
LTLLDKAETATKQRPLSITFIAGVELVLALAGVVVFVLTLAGTIPLAYGRYLVGPGMETLGPFIFLAYAVVMTVTAWGMLRLRNWARHVTIVFAALGVYFEIPLVSAAVISGELLLAIREGVQVIARVAVIWYLVQHPTRELFI